MSELYLQVGTSDISCFREVKVESRNWRIFVSEIVSSDFDIAALVFYILKSASHKCHGRETDVHFRGSIKEIKVA